MTKIHFLQGSKKAAASMTALFMAAALIFTGCGSSATSEPYDYDLSKYIVPANYIGVAVEPVEVTVNSDDIRAEIDKRREKDAETEKVTSGTVASGDAINIDYVGTIDGVEFEGGNTKGMGTDIVVGQAGYIEGFESGLVGAEIGSTVVLDLRFPDDYHAADLAGKDCQFTVEIHSKDVKNVPEYDLEWVKKVSDCKTLNEYEESVYDDLLKTAQEEAEETRNSEIWQKLVEETEALDYPEKEVKAEKEDYKNYIVGYASQFGYSLEDYMSMMGMTEEQLDAEIEDYAKEVVKNEMLLYYIAHAEGITVSEEEYNAEILELCKSMGFESNEEFKEQYGKSVEDTYSRKHFLTNVYIKKVMDFIIENGVDK